METLKHFQSKESDQSFKEEGIIADTLNYLERIGISYNGICHEPAYSLEDCRKLESEIATQIIKNLFLCNRQKTTYYLLLIDGRKTFKTKYLSSQIGSARLSFADAYDLENYLRVEPGSASPLALMYDHDNHVQLLIDISVSGLLDFGCHPCKNTETIKIRMDDFLNSFLPSVNHTPVFVNLPEEGTN